MAMIVWSSDLKWYRNIYIYIFGGGGGGEGGFLLVHVTACEKFLTSDTCPGADPGKNLRGGCHPATAKGSE